MALRAMVKALAMALKRNRFLRIFQLFHWDVDDDHGVSLAEAVSNNASLKKLEFDDVRMGREAGLALALALKHNVTLESFYGRFASLHADTKPAFDEVFENYNVVLQEIRVVSPEWASGWESIVQRNVEIAKERHALAAIARCTCDAGLRSLTDLTFRREVFRLFLPSACNVIPVEFSIAWQY